MESAGKRHGTDGTDRGKRKLEEQEEDSEEDFSKRPRLDDSEESDLPSITSSEIDRMLERIAELSSESSDDSPQACPSQSAPSQPSQPQAGPSHAGSSHAGPSHAGPSHAGPSQPTTMGPPAHPLGNSPPSLVRGGYSPPEDKIPEGVGIPPEDNDA